MRVSRHGGTGRTADIPWVEVGDGFQGLWALEEFVQDVDDVCEARPLGAVVQPALQHELVDGRRTVHGGGQPEGLVDRLHHLWKK